MSEVERDELSVSNDGITVRKSLDKDQFETLAIVFEVQSDRDEPIKLRLVDHIPSEIKLEDVGFHPDYGSEYWVTEEDYVVFEREFNPVEDFTTIYGVREYTEDLLESFLRDPEIELLDPDDPFIEHPDDTVELDDIVSEEDSQAVRDVIAGERDTLPGLEDDEEDELLIDDEEPLLADTARADADTDFASESPQGDDSDPLDIDEPEPIADTSLDTDTMTEPMNDIEAAAHEALSDSDTLIEKPSETTGTGEPEPDGPEDEITVPLTGGVVRVLAKELRDGTADPDAKRLLRKELMPGDSSTDARIKHLQNEVSDLRAYTGALEAFIDENGTGQQLLDDLSNQIDSLTATVDRIDSSVDQTTSTISSIEESIDALESDIGELQDQRAVIDEFEATIESLESELDDAQSDIAELASFRDRLSSAFGGQMTDE